MERPHAFNFLQKIKVILLLGAAPHGFARCRLWCLGIIRRNSVYFLRVIA
jgi:hypothetical protein